MNDTLYKLGLYLVKNNVAFKSHYYRHRKLLQLKCKTFSVVPWVKTLEEKKMLKLWAHHGPLLPIDLSSPRQKKMAKMWNRLFPRDRKFFAFTLRQIQMWSGFSEKSISEFLFSDAGSHWIRSRAKLKRPAYFELDAKFKGTKKTAQIQEERVRKLIRQYPLLTFKDLKDLKTKNLQPIWENFPEREFHRLNFLSSISN